MIMPARRFICLSIPRSNTLAHGTPRTVGGPAVCVCARRDDAGVKQVKPKATAKKPEKRYRLRTMRTSLPIWSYWNEHWLYTRSPHAARPESRFGRRFDSTFTATVRTCNSRLTESRQAGFVGGFVPHRWVRKSRPRGRDADDGFEHAGAAGERHDYRVGNGVAAHVGQAGARAGGRHGVGDRRLRSCRRSDRVVVTVWTAAHGPSRISPDPHARSTG
jgi:hypothetical protein